jgi:hypothetical protein
MGRAGTQLPIIIATATLGTRINLPYIRHVIYVNVLAGIVDYA